jgi:uncharacterized phage infection (PIP) family protein YhgE
VQQAIDKQYAIFGNASAGQPPVADTSGAVAGTAGSGLLAGQYTNELRTLAGDLEKLTSDDSRVSDTVPDLDIINKWGSRQIVNAVADLNAKLAAIGNSTSSYERMSPQPHMSAPSDWPSMLTGAAQLAVLDDLNTSLASVTGTVSRAIEGQQQISAYVSKLRDELADRSLSTAQRRKDTAEYNQDVAKVAAWFNDEYQASLFR